MSRRLLEEGCCVHAFLHISYDQPWSAAWYDACSCATPDSAGHAERLSGLEAQLAEARDELQGERAAHARLEADSALERGRSEADRVRGGG